MEAAGAPSNLRTRRGRWLLGAIAAVSAAALSFLAARASAMTLRGDPLAATGSAPAVQNEFSRPTSAGATVRADINPEGSDTHY